MYAAAGGASLASRQARQKQRQQNKTKALQARQDRLKGPAPVVIPPRVIQPSRQFHQLPSSYLRTPQAQARKLSTNYTTQSKLLLTIDESEANAAATPSHHHHHHHKLHHQHSHQLLQQHHHHHHDDHGRPISPRPVHRHSGSGGVIVYPKFFHKSATATLPLVSQSIATPPQTPSVTIKPIGNHGYSFDSDCVTVPSMHNSGPVHMQIPQDEIIITPATPIASPGRVKKPGTDSNINEDEVRIAPLPARGQLERKCSFYRIQKCDAFDSGAEMNVLLNGNIAQNQNEVGTQKHFDNFSEETSLIYSGMTNGVTGQKWTQCAYCEEGICACEHIECAQGRAAWLERGRRCSVQDNNQNSSTGHRKWVKGNRIQDSSLNSSSDDEDFLGVIRGPSTFANAFLYVGLGTVALGLVIAFVGTGEKGFKTTELRLIGPSLIGVGLVCCILRILFCICPSQCLASSKTARKKNSNKVDADHTTSLLRGETKRVSIARGPSSQKISSNHRKNSKMLNEGMEALRQIATTSLFLQNEKPTTNQILSEIKEPENVSESLLEMRRPDTTLDICDLIDDDLNEDAKLNSTYSENAAREISRDIDENSALERTSSKLLRKRVSLHKQHQKNQFSPTCFETTSGQFPLSKETNLEISSTVKTTTNTINYNLPSPIPHIQQSKTENSTNVLTTNRSIQSPPVDLEHQENLLPGQVEETNKDSGQNMLTTTPSARMSISQYGTVSVVPSDSFHMKITPPTGSVATSEPELLLSPAKLGQ